MVEFSHSLSNMIFRSICQVNAESVQKSSYIPMPCSFLNFAVLSMVSSVWEQILEINYLTKRLGLIKLCSYRIVQDQYYVNK